MTDAEILRAAIEASGLTPRQFAEQVLARDAVTVRRWLSGRVIPPVAKSWLRCLDSVRVRRDGSIRIIVRPQSRSGTADA